MMRFGEMLNRETIKPRDLGETLARLGRYFGQYWYMIVLAVLFVVVSTWTQVTTPELTGQATDCFLVPAGASAFGNFGAFDFFVGRQTQFQRAAGWEVDLARGRRVFQELDAGLAIAAREDGVAQGDARVDHGEDRKSVV